MKNKSYLDLLQQHFFVTGAILLSFGMSACKVQSIVVNDLKGTNTTPPDAVTVDPPIPPVFLLYDNSSPLTAATGVCTGPFTVRSSLESGVAVQTPTDTTITLSDTSTQSGATFFTDAACATTAVTGVTISQGQSEALFWIKDFKWSTAKITAAAHHCTSGVRNVVITGVLTNTWSAAITVLSAPEARSLSSAVWTGSEMIVWGGADGSATYNTGKKYDPATDAWSLPISTINAPAKRENAAGVWTGSEMVIWGGRDAYTVGDYADGAKYNPSSDSWTTMGTVGALSAREGAKAIYTGTEVIFWGGNSLNTGKRYNPTTNIWGAAIQTVGAPSGRIYHSLIWTGSKMIVWGGMDIGATYLQDGKVYDPVGDSWGAVVNTTGAPSPRYGHTAIWTGSKMLIWGGASGFVSNDEYTYDPVTTTWDGPIIPSGSLPPSRMNHVAVWTGLKMIIWGGYNGGSMINSGGIYDYGNNSWTHTAILNQKSPKQVWGASAIWTGSEVILWGGALDGGTNNQGFRYDPLTDSWGAPISVSGAPTDRFFHSAVWTGTEMIIWGGVSGGGTFRSDGGRYNPATDLWSAPLQFSGQPITRAYHTTIWTGTEMIVWGGVSNASALLNDGGRYNPVTDEWGAATATTGAPDARYLASAVWTGSKMIIFGGYNSSGVLSDGPVYNPTSDTWETSIASGPLGRYIHTAIWNGSEMIIWGGVSGFGAVLTGERYVPYTDSWITSTTTVNAPAARYGHSAVWVGDRMFIYGGNVSGTIMSDGQMFNP